MPTSLAARISKNYSFLSFIFQLANPLRQFRQAREQSILLLKFLEGRAGVPHTICPRRIVFPTSTPACPPTFASVFDLAVVANARLPAHHHIFPSTLLPEMPVWAAITELLANLHVVRDLHQIVDLHSTRRFAFRRASHGRWSYCSRSPHRPRFQLSQSAGTSSGALRRKHSRSRPRQSPTRNAIPRDLPTARPRKESRADASGILLQRGRRARESRTPRSSVPAPICTPSSITRKDLIDIRRRVGVRGDDRGRMNRPPTGTGFANKPFRRFRKCEFRLVRFDDRLSRHAHPGRASRHCAADAAPRVRMIRRIEVDQVLGDGARSGLATPEIAARSISLESGVQDTVRVLQPYGS